MKDIDIIIEARNIKRPSFLNYLKLIFNSFQELHGDRYFSDDKSIIGGIAKINNIPVLVLGNERGQTLKERVFHNYGMSYPEGYRKALRLFKLAETFNLPIITFIDTPGAYPGVSAETRGQSSAIAENLYHMSFLKTIIISIIIGEGCSGGALGISICDKLFMLKTSYFSVITPEGCAYILLKDTNIDELIKYMNIVPNRLKDLKVIDGIINDYGKDCFKNIKQVAFNIKYEIEKSICYLRKEKISILLKKRSKRLLSFGNL